MNSEALHTNADLGRSSAAAKGHAIACSTLGVSHRGLLRISSLSACCSVLTAADHTGLLLSPALAFGDAMRMVRLSQSPTVGELKMCQNSPLRPKSSDPLDDQRLSSGTAVPERDRERKNSTCPCAATVWKRASHLLPLAGPDRVAGHTLCDYAKLLVIGL